MSSKGSIATVADEVKKGNHDGSVTVRKRGQKGSRMPAAISRSKRKGKGRTGAGRTPDGTKIPKGQLQSYKHAVQRVKAQLQRVKHEEHLMDVCSAEGWKGASRERAPLTEALKHAERCVLRAKEVIRECVKFCEAAGGARRIPESAYDAEGDVDEKEILCGVCGIYESRDDNDIILCDGCCGCAYHERCLDPPVNAAELSEDSNWLCWACQAKEDILEEVNEQFESSYTLDHKWHEIFADVEETKAQRAQAGRSTGDAAGNGTAGANFLGLELPSEDEDDDEDFQVQEGSDADDEGAVSSSDGEDGDGPRGSGSGSGSESSGGGEEADVEEVEDGPGVLSGGEQAHSPPQGRGKRRRRGTGGSGGEEGDEQAGPSSKEAQGSRRGGGEDGKGQECGDEEGTGLILNYKRRRAHVDYWALNEQLYGGFEGGSSEESDHDFRPGRQRS